MRIGLFFHSHRKTLLSLFLLAIFFCLQYTFFSYRTQSFGFADENEHLTPAWMMRMYGSSLYTDISTNHQPIPIIVAYWALPFLQPFNFFMIIQRIRQIMFVFSCVGAGISIIRFGMRGCIAASLIETVKFYFFGYHLLAESLVAYPLVYIAGILVERSIEPAKKMTRSRYDDWIFGLSLWWIGWSLLPTWPFLVCATMYYLYLRQWNRKTIWTIGSISVGLTILLALFISPVAWYKETILNVIYYFLPYESDTGYKTYLIFVLFPFLSLGSIVHPTGVYYAVLTGAILIGIFFLYTSMKPYRQIWSSLMVLYLLIVLLNLRVTSHDVSFYSAFHLLPQVSFFTMVAVSYIYSIVSKRKGFFRILFGLIYIFLMVQTTTWWWESKHIDPLHEHFIHYGTEGSLASAISAIADRGDTLLSGPQGGYINLLSGVPLTTRQNAYLPWAYGSDVLKKEFEHQFSQLPSFIVFPESNNPYFRYIKQTLHTQYIRVERTDGAKTDLYISEKIRSRPTKEQWQRFSDLFYQIPN